ncbi:MAG: ABC transporter permease subunit [Nitriliruptoraceae bacterium]
MNPRVSADLWRGRWVAFSRDRLAVSGVAIIVAFALGALLHPLLLATVWDPAIYHPVTGNDPQPVARTVVDTITDRDTQIDVARARLRHDPQAQIGDVLDVPRQPAPPSLTHPLGTDPRGRDVLSQLLFGARTAFALGAVAAVTTVVLGTGLAAVAAVRGGWLAALLLRLADYVLLLPAIPFVIFASAIVDVSIIALGVVLGITSGLGPTAIVLHAQARTIVVQPFVDAARLAGGGTWPVVRRHVMPHLAPVALLSMMTTVALAIGAEAILSLFGLVETSMSWGVMLGVADAGGYFADGIAAWWLLVPAGGAVTLLAGASYLVGRGFDTLVDPRLRSVAVER